MKIWDRVRAFYAKTNSIIQCAVLYVGAAALDVLSSLHMPPGFEETNRFARHADGSFWLQHAVITDGMNTVETVFMSAGLYIGVRMLGTKYAKFVAGLPWLWYAFIHLDAAFTNALYQIPHLYVPTAQDMFRNLMGY